MYLWEEEWQRDQMKDKTGGLLLKFANAILRCFDCVCMENVMKTTWNGDANRKTMCVRDGHWNIVYYFWFSVSCKCIEVNLNIISFMASPQTTIDLFASAYASFFPVCWSFECNYDIGIRFHFTYDIFDVIQSTFQRDFGILGSITTFQLKPPNRMYFFLFSVRNIGTVLFYCSPQFSCIIFFQSIYVSRRFLVGDFQKSKMQWLTVPIPFENQFQNIILIQSQCALNVSGKWKNVVCKNKYFVYLPHHTREFDFHSYISCLIVRRPLTKCCSCLIVKYHAWNVTTSMSTSTMPSDGNFRLQFETHALSLEMCYASYFSIDWFFGAITFQNSCAISTK